MILIKFGYAHVNFHPKNGELMISRNFALKMATERRIENL